MAGIGWTKSISGLPSWTADYTNHYGNEWDMRAWAASNSAGLISCFGRILEPDKLPLTGFIVETAIKMKSVHSSRQNGDLGF